MKILRLIVACALVLAVPVGAAAQADAFDLHAAVQTPRGAADRPITTTITQLDLGPTGMHVEFSKRDGPTRWPDVPWGTPGDSLQYTVWIGAQLADGWHVAASLNVWYGLDHYGGPMATPQQYSSNLWYLDRALGQHTPTVGEPLAFVVTAGGDRGTDAHLVLERSAVVVVPMPGPGGASYTFPAAAPPPVIVTPPVVIPAPLPVPAPLPSIDLTAVLTQLQMIDARIVNLAGRVEEVNVQVQAGRDENKAFFSSVLGEWKRILGYAAPIVGAIFAGRATK